MTIQFKHRDLDLIIRSQKNFVYVVKYLMYSINSFDGTRGSGETILLQNQMKYKKENALKTKQSLKYTPDMHKRDKH